MTVGEVIANAEAAQAWLRSFTDADMAQARTLHYDMRRLALQALGPCVGALQAQQREIESLREGISTREPT